MFSRLTALVSGTSLPFDVAGEYAPSGFGAWQHCRGTLRADGSPVSIFRLAAPSKSDARLEAGRHGVKRLRTLRHPNVLVFKESVEVEERGETVLYLVTEAVTPLAEVDRGGRKCKSEGERRPGGREGGGREVFTHPCRRLPTHSACWQNVAASLAAAPTSPISSLPPPRC